MNPIEKPWKYSGPTLTATELVAEAVAWFDGHPERVAYDVESDQCRYRTDNGRRCAIGRWLLNYEETMEGLSLDTLLERYGSQALHPAVRHLPLELLRPLQYWHDLLQNSGVPPDVRDAARDSLVWRAAVLDRRTEEQGQMFAAVPGAD